MNDDSKTIEKTPEGLNDERFEAKRIVQKIIKSPTDLIEKKSNYFGEKKGLKLDRFEETEEEAIIMTKTMSKFRPNLKVLKERSFEGGYGQEKSLIVGKIKRRILMATIKSLIKFLLGRTHQYGGFTQQFDQKREWSNIHDEKKMKRERTAQWMRKIFGI